MTDCKKNLNGFNLKFKAERGKTYRNNIRVYFSSPFCAAPPNRANICRRLWGGGEESTQTLNKTSLRWMLSMSVWKDNRKCGLLLSLYRSWLKMFKHININKSSTHWAEPLAAVEKWLGCACLYPSCTSNHIPKQLWGQASATSLGRVNKEH